MSSIAGVARVTGPEFHPKTISFYNTGFLDCLWQIMSIEDVEKILDETQESIEYQKVNMPHRCLSNTA